MKTMIAVLALLVLSGVCPLAGLRLAAAQESADRIGPEVVWNPSGNVLREILAGCASQPAPSFGECFAGGMQRAGASPQAIAFTRKINNDGYARGFRRAGPVALVFVKFPFRANENQGVLLAGDSSDLIDVDDQTLRPAEELTKNPAYASLAGKYPNVMLWAGDRNGANSVVMKRLPGGGARIVAGYFLRDGCRACRQVGTARYAFDFDRAGKFAGAKLLSVAATPPGKGSR